MTPTRRPAVSVTVFLLLFISSALWAQRSDESYAFVTYAEGYNLSVFRNDELTTYDVLVDNVIGMPLLPGDIVQTDGDTFVEMQVMPSRTVVKIAENTTFEIERIGGSGGGSFSMSYGRLRARVERVARDDRFEIRGFTAVAGVRGTDFGYDMVVERPSPSTSTETGVAQLQTRVYVFDGEVDVTETVTETVAPEPQVVRLQANEMVQVTPAEPGSVGLPPGPVVFRQDAIDPGIQLYWLEQNFREEPVDPGKVEKEFPGITVRVQQLIEERRRFEELQRLRREGLLGPTDDEQDQVSTVPETVEEVREPEQITLDAPADARIQRLITPSTGEGEARQLRRAGHWMVGLGVVTELAGLAGAWYVDGARSADDLKHGGPSTGAIIGGGVLIGSGLVSYLLSLAAR